MEGPSSSSEGQAKQHGPRRIRIYKSAEDVDFGFTLRHFIVYPPESYTIAGGVEGGGPVETMFVVSVSVGGPAWCGGLRPGDRVLAVNGESTASRPYQQVVHIIQQSTFHLTLTVVAKEEDPVQRHFGETAYREESNLPRIPQCPEDDRLSGSAIDDSVIMSRIKKSCEQKEEFLRRGSNKKEVVWPPVIPASRGTFVMGGPVSHPPAPLCPMPPGGTPTTASISPQPVAHRARLYEAGLCHSDRTMLYRSELSRLGNVKSCVTARRNQFETRALEATRSLDSTPSARLVTLPVQLSVPETHLLTPPYSLDTSSVTTTSTSPSSGRLSGNRTIPVGGTKLHCEPPLQPSSSPDLSSRGRSNSLEDTNNRRHRAVRQASYLAAVNKFLEMRRPSSSEGSSSGGGGGSEGGSTQTSAASTPVASSTMTPSSGVIRRNKSHDDDHDRAMRRVSYLKATSTDGRVGMSKDGSSTLEGPVSWRLGHSDSKKSSWRSGWAVLSLPNLYLHKEKPTIQKLDEEVAERVDVSSNAASLVDEGKKRIKVGDLVLQLDTSDDLASWMHALQPPHSAPPHNNHSPTPKSTKPHQVDGSSSSSSSSTSSKSVKTWKGRMAKQLRRMGGSSSPVAPSPSYPDGATIGVPLELCPMSDRIESVPALVEMCTSIVDSRGLDITGIYRVPGNAAAVSSLAEALNNGALPDLLLTSSSDPTADPRWHDVNVISSLLKQFFRKLPDCLLTTELYPLFIEADKMENPQRVYTLRKLVEELPEVNVATLRHLMQHLKRVVDHSGINKMEARNLAIVFGPTLIKAADNSMATMVTDMSHQCRIVETLITYVDWCFSNDPPECLVLKEDNASAESESPNSLLLDNIHKVQGLKESPTKDLSAKDIVSSIISAANRKMQKARTRKAVYSITEESLPSDNENKHHKGKGSGSKDRESHPPSCKPITVASSVSESVLFSGSVASKILSSNESSCSSGCKDEHCVLDSDSSLPIRTYNGLDSITQQRVRRFEMETKAMLLRSKKETSPMGTGLPAIVPVTIAGETLPSEKTSYSKQAVDEGRCASVDSVSNQTDSDPGSDLLVSLTSTFDAKLRDIRPNSAPVHKMEQLENETEVERKEEEKENCAVKLRRCESLNKREAEKRESIGKLRRTESLNKKEVGLSKTEKMEANKRRQSEGYKNKRKTGGGGGLTGGGGGGGGRSIKRRHTVGGTKDLVDKVTSWLDNKSRTSSPDLSRHVLIEVSKRQPLESHM